MEQLERLAKVLRYAGLNLTPQIIALVLDVPTRTLIENLKTKLDENPELSITDIDAIVAEITAAQEAAVKVEEEKAAPKKSKAKKSVLDKA